MKNQTNRISKSLHQSSIQLFCGAFTFKNETATFLSIANYPKKSTYTTYVVATQIEIC